MFYLLGNFAVTNVCIFRMNIIYRFVNWNKWQIILLNNCFIIKFIFFSKVRNLYDKTQSFLGHKIWCTLGSSTLLDICIKEAKVETLFIIKSFFFIGRLGNVNFATLKFKHRLVHLFSGISNMLSFMELYINVRDTSFTCSSLVFFSFQFNKFSINEGHEWKTSSINFSIINCW